jgi:hypothetical protein
MKYSNVRQIAGESRVSLSNVISDVGNARYKLEVLIYKKQMCGNTESN